MVGEGAWQFGPLAGVGRRWPPWDAEVLIPHGGLIPFRHRGAHTMAGPHRTPRCSYPWWACASVAHAHGGLMPGGELYPWWAHAHGTLITKVGLRLRCDLVTWLLLAQF